MGGSPWVRAPGLLPLGVSSRTAPVKWIIRAAEIITDLGQALAIAAVVMLVLAGMLSQMNLTNFPLADWFSWVGAFVY